MVLIQNDFKKFLACSTQNEHSYRVVLNCGLFIFIATKLLAHANFIEWSKDIWTSKKQ